MTDISWCLLLCFLIGSKKLIKSLADIKTWIQSDSCKEAWWRWFLALLKEIFGWDEHLSYLSVVKISLESGVQTSFIYVSIKRYILSTLVTSRFLLSLYMYFHIESVWDSYLSYLWSVDRACKVYFKAISIENLFQSFWSLSHTYTHTTFPMNVFVLWFGWGCCKITS